MLTLTESRELLLSQNKNWQSSFLAKFFSYNSKSQKWTSINRKIKMRFKQNNMLKFKNVKWGRSIERIFNFNIVLFGIREDAVWEGRVLWGRIQSKAMRNSEIYAITCYGEFRTSVIPTVRNLTEINSISKNPELRGNLTEILTELRNFRY